jgi:hypothetical protein
MQFGVLITNNIVGNHPADKWAEVTVGRIMAVFDIDADSNTPEAKQARKDKRLFEQELLDIVEKHHQAVHDFEQAQLEEKGSLRLVDTLDAQHHVADILDEAIAEVVEAAKINPQFTAYFAKPEVQKHIRDDMFAVDFTTSIHANRLGHCDNNPHCPYVKAWKKGADKHGFGHAHHFMYHHLPDDHKENHPMHEEFMRGHKETAALLAAKDVDTETK